MSALFVAALTLVPLPSVNAPPEITDPADREVLEAFLKHARESEGQCTPERVAELAAQPEDITWVGSNYVRMALAAYRLTGDTSFIDSFVTRMDNFVGALTEGPDGYLGWYGLALELFRHPDHPDQPVDVMLTSYVMSGLIAEFAEEVQADAELSKTYGEAAARYLQIATEHLIPKWDARGCYKELGDGGAVNVTHPDLHPVKGSLTQPHNKHSKFTKALLHLYIATGRDEYLTKAIRFGTRFKRCLTLVDDHYSWNYWDPSGAWDINPGEPGQWKHWIGAEHRNGYYSLSVSQAVLLYEHGLVFDKTDMERFVATQTQVCWNGDAGNPKWYRVDGQEADGAYLCGSLAALDERIFDVAYGPGARRERLAAKDHSWQGGVVAMDYLEFKYLTYPRWRSGEPEEAHHVADYLAKPENRALAEELAFEVTEPSYGAPRTPRDMDPMPGRE